MANKVYEIVKDLIVSRLNEANEKGINFRWEKPWSGGAPYACNYTTKEKPYRGVNALFMPDGEYLTFNQINALSKKDSNVRLKKGSKSLPVFFFKFSEAKKTSEEDAQDNEAEMEVRKVPIFRYYRVFDINDVEGIESHCGYVPVEHTLTEDMDTAFAACTAYAKANNITIEFVKNSARAFFSPSERKVVLPLMEQFESSYEYFSTVFHELVHSTSLSLERELSSKRNMDAYAKEELVAEIGAAMLCHYFHIFDDASTDNSLAYIQQWSKPIIDASGSDIVHAAQLAQHACDLIVGKND